MIMVWIGVLIGLFSCGVIYFYITPTIMEILDQMLILGAPADTIHGLLICYHMSFIILFVGTILYGLIYSTKTEPDTYVQ